MARQKGPAKKRTRPGRLRIVAGKWRNRLLPIAEHDGLRPTSERVRETLFNWLTTQVTGSHCLDLFAGTGALGFEALSRDAASATLVEKSPAVAAALNRSAALLDAEGVTIECADALAFLRRPAVRRYAIVFLDPPFSDDLLEESCRLLHSNGWLADRASVYIEQDRNHPVPILPDGWRVDKDSTAGNVRYMLLCPT